MYVLRGLLVFLLRLRKELLNEGLLVPAVSLVFIRYARAARIQLRSRLLGFGLLLAARRKVGRSTDRAKHTQNKVFVQDLDACVRMPGTVAHAPPIVYDMLE